MSSHRTNPHGRGEAGAALLTSMVLILLIGISAFLAFSQGDSSEAAKQRRTDQALAEAKAALIGYALARPLDVSEAERRLGELPCPDRDDDGDAELACSSETDRIGRLPWRTLGLPDLRDGDGERLWYAVSHIYKLNPRTTCAVPEDAGCLNSDAEGSITVRDATGGVTHDAVPQNPPSHKAAIAVIIAPGAIIKRQDGTVQVRNDATARSLAVNYLDIAYGEDNANFADYSSNGFVAGPVRDASSGNQVTNDRIAVVSHADIMPSLEKRVAQEVGNCLDAYAAANNGRYPWAADLTLSALNHDYGDADGLLTGRVADTLGKTRTSSSDTMSDTWPASPACFLGQVSLHWWRQWKLRVFYAVADSYKPANGAPTPPCSSCMYAQTASTTIADVRYFVVVAGKRLQGVSGNQPRTTNITIAPETLYNPANFLEQENATMFSTPGQVLVRAGPAGASFNDVAVYKF